MEDKFQSIFRILKIIVAIVLGMIGLAFWLAYKMSIVFGVPGFKM